MEKKKTKKRIMMKIKNIIMAYIKFLQISHKKYTYKFARKKKQNTLQCFNDKKEGKRRNIKKL
jgi:hypothetical protein